MHKWMQSIVVGGALSVMLTTPLYAYAPEISLRPLPRPQSTSGEGTGLSGPPSDIGAVILNPSVPGVVRSLIPNPRPRNFGRLVERAQRRADRLERRQSREAERTRASYTQSGSVCGDPRIRGEEIAPIAGRLQGCGLSNPVRVTEIDGVTLSQAATINCETAEALRDWIIDGVRPAVGSQGGGVSSLRIVAHYACRTRNNRAGARISEHGRGRAVDVAAINLVDGSALRVLTGWRDRSQRRALRAMHAAACGPFGTVLGPDSDRHHQDHFHFDTASYRSGPYCR
ncbi:extensin-like domain-containing protein [Cochlodiniinecator piscidefendens]|uniref:extensin-like domain-containing protein n=1 Tax=Cochlodiniinecator piscidefendens TaxID=2715756 RepID=UPI001E5DB3FD|nr:extensin family protein [Cochlodiniinecator piscidefendens]